MSEPKQPTMMRSEDYNELIDMALSTKDKEWFDELLKKQKLLREMEIEMRRMLGVIDQDIGRLYADQREPGEMTFTWKHTINDTEPGRN